MTDNEIITALECCITNKCDECAIYKECHNENGKGRVQVVLDLINRQKAEIAELQEILGGTAKVQSLTCARVRIEAIKEFAERLKEREDYIVLSDSIDDLVKEMTEQKG